MNSETLFILLQLYGLALFVMYFLFIKQCRASPQHLKWGKFFAIILIDTLGWLAILLIGGLLFKNERSFILYLGAVVVVKGLISIWIRPILPKYMNILHFSPPIISGSIWAALISRY
ncbi:hypothetical protein [Geothrix sp. 21YS21S-4]|uniref:hypothetical protein n=1 Tax=Geothrix sp. 21YS21S-4 TaxID=3068889 RepID=UPI0027B96ABB|nr:hypothetical protein [Geothrix sp. 21YS21S-4]